MVYNLQISALASAFPRHMESQESRRPKAFHNPYLHTARTALHFFFFANLFMLARYTSRIDEKRHALSIAMSRTNGFCIQVSQDGTSQSHSRGVGNRFHA